jgi:hypothetical protein
LRIGQGVRVKTKHRSIFASIVGMTSNIIQQVAGIGHFQLRG